MFTTPQPPRIHLPKGWQGCVKSAVLHTIALAHYTIVYARAWAADSINVRVRLPAENGMKLLAKGARINRSVLNRLLKHKLVKPIDHTTTISNAVHRESLVTAASELMENDTEMGRLLRRLRGQNFPQQVFNRVKQSCYPLSAINSLWRSACMNRYSRMVCVLPLQQVL
jgi:hypothetical protein